ncbi:mucin-5AC isoform X1 [Anopheles stephensi]|uniref:mucin-5AC isoform X1 n=1 Tax=Anopheles stephensi TaxID=30069 RepID=UPI001658BD5C|nr:mucin-5AC isoform X1 [Anopheles stephensi]
MMSSVDLRRGTVRWSRRCAVQYATSLALLLASLLSSAYSSPVFPFTSFQASRNLRHLPCVVRSTGDEGICMFAIDCFKSNGTHLGVCIDKIFFGSCCQVNDDRLLFDPDITDNSIDHNSAGNFQHFPQSSLMNTHRKPPLTETRLPTTPAGNGTKYELLSTSTTTRRTTAKNNRRTTTTVRTTKAPMKVQQKDDLQTTTEYQEFTTFQYVQSSKNPAGSQSTSTTSGGASKRPPVRPSSPSVVTYDNRTSTTRTTTPKPYKNRRPTTNKTTTVRPPNRRPPQPLTTTTETSTTILSSTTRKAPAPNTRQPTTSATIASRKPPSSIAASQTQTTHASRRPTTTHQSSPKTESTTPSVTYSRRPTTSPSLVPLTKPTSNRRRPTTTSTTSPTTTTVPTTVASDTTRAPRPRPKPTSQVATVPATSLDHLIETNSASSEITSSAAPVSSSTTRTTYPTTTVKVTQPTTPTPTPTPASSTKRTTQSEPSIQTSTVKVSESSLELGDTADLATLSRPGLVTWTSILEDTPTERPNVNQGPTTSNSWILIQTLTPEEVIASNQTNQHEPSPSSTHIPPASVEVSFSQDTKLPIESLLPEAAYVYNTVQEEPAQNVLLLPDALSIHSQVTSTSQTPGHTNVVSLEAQAKTTESSVPSIGSSTIKQSTVAPESTSTTVRHSSIVPSTTDSSTMVTGHGSVSSTVSQPSITKSPPKPSSIPVEINESVVETTPTTVTSTIAASTPTTTIIPASVAPTHFTSSAAPTLTTSDMFASVSEQTSSASSEESGTSSTTDAGSKRPIDTTSTTEAMLVRETTTAAEESIESATEGSGEEEASGSGSEEGSSEEEEEEEEEGTDESEETTDATTASIENVTDSQNKLTNESSTVTSSSTQASTSASQSTTSSSTSTSLEPNTLTASTLSPVSISAGMTSPSSSSSVLTTTSGNTTTASPQPPAQSNRDPTTTEGTTTGMPVKFPEQPPASNQTAALPTTTTLAMLANVTTDGVTLAPDFLTTSTLPTLEGIDYRSVCGKRMFPEPRIVGGTKAAFGRWPWQISLRQWRTSTYLHKCGAALLNENWAITAAHCVDNVPPSDLLLRLGEYDLALEEEPYGYQERRVQIVASHPQFDPRTFEYDLALLRFYEPVVFQPNIIPVCVPENDENFIGRTAFVTGWGRLYEDGPLPSVLQEVTVPVIENKICETMYRSAGYIEHIPHIFICAGWKKGGYDSCEGDSGGPMVIQRPDKRFLLAGVISWGIGCAEPNQPGVYTRISEFRDWINQILQF